MSVGDDEWNSGRSEGNLASRVATFLKLKYPEAYTAIEVLAAVDPMYERLLAVTPDGFLQGTARVAVLLGCSVTLTNALKELEQSGEIESREIKTDGLTQTHYRYVERG